MVTGEGRDGHTLAGRSGKDDAGELGEVKAELQQRIDDRIPEVGGWLRASWIAMSPDSGSPSVITTTATRGASSGTTVTGERFSVFATEPRRES